MDAPPEPNAIRADREGQVVSPARLEQVGDGTLRVHLGGSFQPGWAGALALGLSRERISIQRGYACRAPRSGWSAYFDLRALEGAPALKTIDFYALATRARPDAAPVAIELERYTLVPMIGGAVQLGVRGPDRVGFLGGLLDRLAGLSLFPEEMQIETYGRVAEDRFQLRSVGGAAVSQESRRDLDTLLAFWRRPVTPRRIW